jgi:hypothetical protein
MDYLLFPLLMVLAGGLALWLVGKFFSLNSQGLFSCMVGALVVEVIGLSGIPYVPFIVLFVILIKFFDFGGVPAFVATGIYAIVRGVILSLAVFSSLV